MSKWHVVLDWTPEKIIERLSWFGIEYVRDGTFLPTGYKVQVFRFSPNKLAAVYLLKGFRCEPCDFVSPEPPNERLVFFTEDPPCFTSQREEVSGEIVVFCSFYNLLTFPWVLITQKKINDLIRCDVETKFYIDHKESIIMCYNFCQGNVPAGVLLDFLREKTGLSLSL